MNWKSVSLMVLALAMLAALVDFHRRSKDHDAAELLQEKSAEHRAESARPMQHLPEERDIITLAERDSSAFCHPADRSVDGCELDAALVDNQWTVIASPYLGSPGKGYACCAPDKTALLCPFEEGRAFEGGEWQPMNLMCKKRAQDQTLRNPMRVLSFALTILISGYAAQAC